jgi:hypothetical protein
MRNHVRIRAVVTDCSKSRVTAGKDSVTWQDIALSAHDSAQESVADSPICKGGIEISLFAKTDLQYQMDIHILPKRSFIQ